MWKTPHPFPSQSFVQIDPAHAEMLLNELEIEETDLACPFELLSAVGRLHVFFPAVPKRRMFVEAVKAARALVSLTPAPRPGHSPLHQGLLFEMLVSIHGRAYDSASAFPDDKDEAENVWVALLLVNAIRSLARQRPVKRLLDVSASGWQDTLGFVIADGRPWELPHIGDSGGEPGALELEACARFMRRWVKQTHRADLRGSA